MPGMRCTVAACNNSFIKTKNAGLSITYHQFPRSGPLRELWIKCCRREGDWNPGSCHICSVHFTSDDYKCNPHTNKRRLKPTAVPSQFLEDTSQIVKKDEHKLRRYNKANKTENTLKLANAIPAFDDNVYPDYTTDCNNDIYVINSSDYNHFMKEKRIAEEDETESVEVKYSEIMQQLNTNLMAACTESTKEPHEKEIATQTEDDQILQIWNLLIQKNVQLENKVKQLEMKLTQLENFVRNTKLK